MLNVIKSSFHLTNKYIILATPLILFSLLSSLYLLFSLGGNSWGLVVAAVLSYLMTGAFLSGWFYLVVKCIKDSEQDDVNKLLSEFPTGVGEYFLPMLGVIAISFVVAIAMFTVSFILGMHYIGDVGVPSDAFMEAAKSVEALKAFLAGLTTEQVYRLQNWNLLLFGTMILTYFILMFYSPALIYKTKNPLKAIWIAWKDLFSRKFFKNAGFFIMVFISYFILSILSAIFGMNVIMHFVFTLINFYFLTYMVILLFNYYYSNYIKIGSNIDTRV